VQVGEDKAEPGSMLTPEWNRWTEHVLARAEDLGAWFILGTRPDLDDYVIDVLDREHSREQIAKLNCRSVTYWREA
jgi:hypothetical protein